MFNRHNMTCIFAVGFGSFTSLLSSTTIEVAFPQMMGALALDLNQVQWTITLYMIVMTIAMLLAADVVKRIGVKSTFVLSFVIMSIGSLIGGLSDNLLVLLTGRFFQGFAAGLQAPLATIILGQIFPKNKMGIAMGFFGAIMLMAPAMGPVVGGYIIEVLSWREVFHFQLPMAALSIILAMFYLPNTTDVTRGVYDWLGLFLLSLLLSCFFLAFVFVRKQGLHSTEFVTCAGLFVALSYAFYHIEKRAEHPLVSFGLFTDVIFSTNIVVIFVLGICLFSSILLIPFYLLEVKGLSARQTGEALLIPGLIMAIMAPFSGWLSDRFSPREIILTGLIINAVAAFAIVRLEAGFGMSYIILATIVSRIGLSMMLPSLYVSSLKRLDERSLGYGASMINFSRQMGGALGVLLFSALYERSRYITEHQIWTDLGGKLEKQGFTSQLENAAQYQNLQRGVDVLSGNTALKEVFLFNMLMTIGCIVLILFYYLKAGHPLINR